MHAKAVARTAALFAAVTTLVAAQADVTDAQLETASAGRTVRLGPAVAGRSPIVELPLEVYVARVLAGEGEPRAGEAAHQALAIAIRTYALANAARHVRDGFDLCDGTHCQVPRAATAASRRAAWATTGQVLTYDGVPAEVFYSASCGGYSESAGQVWPGLSFPYLQAAPDDVHGDEVPWTLELALDEVQRALTRAGFEGRLRDVRVDERTASGRVARVQLAGLAPDVMAGDPFRAAVGTTRLRSTAFAVERRGDRLRFTGRGYGHGVGMCVIGAGRRAERGDTAAAILAQYFPGLAIERIAEPAGSAAGGPSAPRVPASTPTPRDPVERLTAVVHDRLSARLGVSLSPITVRVHDSLESFRRATGQPWWVSSVSEGTSIDLAPAALLAQRDGVDAALRTAVAELLVAPALAGRPRWVRVGAARYFGRDAAAPVESSRNVRCPADAELTLAVSAVAQREAETRAEVCFARAYARTNNWRTVK